MSQQLRCEACGINFETKEAMMEHGAKVHHMTATPHQHQHFKCQACGAEFETMEELQGHGKTSHAM
ncbi:MAG: hypothetical protein JRN20_20505 [Nitrososphaerota archaeon]|nr:hypothetical protein [Nitrososphaerota archaeon]